MSIKYEVLKRLVKALSIKRMSNKPADEIIALRKRRNEGLVVPELKDADIECGRMTVDGCAAVRMPRRHKARRDAMFIAGGGMLHCCPVIPIAKEARAGWDMMVGRMKAWRGGE